MTGILPRGSAAAGLLLALLAPLAWADDAKPAHKDSPKFLWQKEVTLETAVEPARAKPGDTVTYRVTARVKEPWHIYTYARAQADEGPRHTQFDLFDAGGLKPAGDWSASREPITRKEPAFPDLDSVSFFEDEVTWSLPLKVPAGTAAGEHAIQSQVYFQICNESSCKPPVYATAPAATLTIAGGAAKPEAQAAAVLSAPPSQPDRPNNPKQVRLSARVEPAEVRPGQVATLKVTAALEPNWHIFSTTQAGPGGLPTTFEAFGLGGLTVGDQWAPSGEPTRKAADPADPLAGNDEYYEGEVTWTTSVLVPADAKPGPHPFGVQVSYQVCSDTTCVPGRQTLPPLTLTVLSPDPTAPAPAAEVAAAPPAPPKSLPGDDPATLADAAAAPKASNEVEKTLKQGLVPFLLLSAGAGLLALVMPCVWPMVPITVNFFVKQGHARQGRSTTGLAITYCLAIIGIFTLVGVLFSAVFGASAAQNLATSLWLNLFVALLFVAFGLSLLGLFEFRLPSGLLNASAQGESRGGLVGVIFMALTLTITSFTCTFPVVGGLLVMAAGGDYLYPVIGLATFATVLALPFFLLALAPGLLSKLPRSGDWMNAVKVVGGLVEIGAAFKFINNAELALGTAREDCWFNAPTVLTLWIVLLLVCGVYLLGLFRTDHDHDQIKVGPLRLLAGAATIFLALYLSPALFGRPPRGQIWDRLVVGLLPPDIDSLKAPAAAGGPAEPKTAVATSTDPEQAERQQTNFHGVAWGMSYEAAVEQARAEGKPILIDFTGEFCSNCRQMEQAVMPRPEVVDLLQRFVTVQLYTDIVPIKSLSKKDKDRLATKNQLLQGKLVNDAALPFYVAVSPDGEVLNTISGYREPTVYVEFLETALTRSQAGGKVARAEPR